MYDFSGLQVQKNVADMSITKSQDVSDYGCCGHATRVAESHREPTDWFFCAFGKVVAHDRSEFLTNRLIRSGPSFWAVIFAFLELQGRDVSFEILWVIPGE